jgi:hypothetical protein
VSLDAIAYSTFLELTGAPGPNDIGDGEAATIAYAQQTAGVALLDDRKAAKIALARSSPIHVLHTLDLYASASIAKRISDQDLEDLVFNSLRNARMRVAADFRPWVAALIGSERMSGCPSIGSSHAGSTFALPARAK